MRLRWAGLAALAIVIGVGAWAQEKKAAEAMESQVRRTGFQYYVTTLLGAADEHLKVARMPIYTVRDGVVTTRDEKATRALLAGFANRLKALGNEEDAKANVLKAVLPIFEEASIQFIGANTANLTFLVRPAKTEKDGEFLATLTLFRKEGEWKVISETTDSAAVPPEYLK